MQRFLFRSCRAVSASCTIPSSTRHYASHTHRSIAAFHWKHKHVKDGVKRMCSTAASAGNPSLIHQRYLIVRGVKPSINNCTAFSVTQIAGCRIERAQSLSSVGPVGTFETHIRHTCWIRFSARNAKLFKRQIPNIRTLITLIGMWLRLCYYITDGSCGLVPDKMCLTRV
jgi:hypothetical protein